MLTSLPNLLTYSRILLIPALMGTFYMEGDKAHWIALGIFVTASITDFLDGYLARAWQQQSSLGRMLDPIADKLLVAAALLVLVANETVGWATIPAATVILCREILVSGLREYLAELHVNVPVTRLAKWKTGIQIGAIGFLLAGPAGTHVFPPTLEVGAWLLWAAAILTLYTGYDYLRAGLHHVLEEDEASVKAHQPGPSHAATQPPERKV